MLLVVFWFLFPFHTAGWFCLLESTILVAVILIFMYTVPNFKRTKAERAEQTGLAVGSEVGDSYTLFLLHLLPKKEGVREGSNLIN